MFEENERVVCVDTSGVKYFNIELYGIYTIKEVFGKNGMKQMYLLKELKGNYSNFHFISLLEYRRNKLLKLKELICTKEVIKLSV